MGKILLFYKYIAIEYPKQLLKWQRKICTDLGLKGRIILGHEGINGTLGGTVKNIEHYKTIMDNHQLFKGIDFKESPGGADNFPKLSIVAKDEIVNLGQDPKKITPKDGGIHLTPQQVHELLNNKPEDLVILDARNKGESDVGTFKDAITPNTKHFRELPEYIDNNLDQFKDKQVLMYCTGGIRCERATTYLKTKNVAKEVYQIEGGIHRYVEQFPEGHFRGKNYVFDSRVTVCVNDDILGSCGICSTSCDEYINCLNALCNKHFICCNTCLKQYNNTCGATCMELVRDKKVQVRPPSIHPSTLKLRRALRMNGRRMNNFIK